MGCKFIFKRVFFVASLCLAGLFGASSIALNYQVKEMPAVQEAKAADSDYKIIYFHLACGWGNDNEFDYHIGSQHHYIYKIGETLYDTKNYYGYGSDGDLTYSEVIAAKTVKIYLPKTATSIQFVCTSSPWKNQGRTIFASLENNEGKAYVLDSYDWDGGFGDAGLQDSGHWETYEDLISNYFGIAYYTVLSGWNGGQSNLNTFWVWSQLTMVNDDRSGGYVSSCKKCCYRLDHALTTEIDGTTYVRVLIPYSDTAWPDIIRFQTVSDDNPNNTNKTLDLTYDSWFEDYTNPTFYVNTNDSGSTKKGYWHELGDKVGYFLVGSGSFVKYGLDWNIGGGVPLEDNLGNHGALMNVFLEKGDIFKINDGGSMWSGWSEYKSGGSNFSQTVMSTKNGKIECSVDVQNSINWWENDGCKTRVITEGSSEPSHNLVIDLSKGYGKQTFEIYTDITKIYFCRYNSSGEYNKDIDHYGANLSTGWDSSSIDWVVKYSLLSGDHTERSTRVTGTNIKVNNTGYYNLYLNTSDYIYIDSINEFELGEAVYLDLNGQGWESDGRHVYARFWNSSYGSEVTNVEMTLVHDHWNNNHVYEAVVPSLPSANPNYVTFYRGTTIDFENADNKIEGLAFTMGSNTFGLNSYVTGAWYTFVTRDDRAEYYGKYFNNQVVCTGEIIDPLHDNWSLVETEFGNMCANAQAVARGMEANENGTEIEKAVSKYDRIVFVRRYAGHNDFMNRNNTNGTSGSHYAGTLSAYNNINTNLLNIGDDEMIPAILIIVTSSISILSISVLSILLVKKRRAKEYN